MDAEKAEVVVKRAATALFGRQDAAERYLVTPNYALGGKRPVDLLETPEGAAVVLGELRCQEDGGPL